MLFFLGDTMEYEVLVRVVEEGLSTVTNRLDSLEQTAEETSQQLDNISESSERTADSLSSAGAEASRFGMILTGLNAVSSDLDRITDFASGFVSETISVLMK